MKNLSIGRYINTNSPIHHLDPRIKILGLITFVTLLIKASTWQHYLALASYTFLTILLCKIPVVIFLKSISSLLKIIIMSATIQLLFTNSGNIYHQWGPFVITDLGLVSAGGVAIRFSLILMMSSVIGLSTKPLDLSAGIEKLLLPLEIFGFKIQALALMVSIALRFVPTLFDEVLRLKKAQESRGLIFESGHFLQRMKKLLPLFIPVFAASFYRAKELADAIDARGYAQTAKRSRFKIMKICYKNAIFAGSVGILVLIFLYFG